MATTQQYSLRWNNYFRHLTYALDSHRSNDDFVDVSLCCDGKKIKAHKVVLSACSSYFKEIFKENPHPHPVIIFKFIKFEDLNSIIEFMYQGEVNVQQEALQSFLQTAELLAVQGLTAEEKEKPKAPRIPIDEQQLIKTIPSTIRAINENTTTQSSQTIEIPTIAVTQQQQPQPQHHQPQTQQLVQQQQQQQQQLQTLQVPSQLQQHQQQQQQKSHQQIQLTTSPVATTTVVAAPATMKKRKITFTDEDDNIYTTETVDYTGKDEATLVKTTSMTYIPTTVKMDIPEYIVADDDGQQIGEASAQTQQVTQDAGTGQTVTQYTSEYEILTESEIDEKYQPAESGDNSEITIEMGRLLTTATAHSNESGKEDKGNSLIQDLPNNKWTECQFCKMVITTVNLWRHIRTQHTPQPPRRCDLCQKNFKNKYSLREHIRISHEQKIAVKAEH